MKKFYAYGFGCLLITAFISCNKNNGNSGSGYTLTLSNSSAKLQQPVYASINSTTGSQPVVRWSVSPAANSWISASSGGSVVLFSQPGNYTVTAGYYADSMAVTPFGSSSSDVNVNDSIYGGTMPVCDVDENKPIVPGDQLSLSPLYSVDTGLVLLVHTQQLYPNFPGLNFTILSTGWAGFSYSFDSVEEFPCYATNGPTPATNILYLGVLADGTYPLSLKFLGVTYTGSVVVTGTQCSFTWGYSAGITLSPLQVSK